MKLRNAIGIMALVFALPNESPARSWITVTGQSFEGEFVRVEGTNAIFTVKEKEYPYPLNRLSVDDRLFIGRIVNQQAAAVASPPPPSPESLTTPAIAEKAAAAVQLAGQPLKPGGSVEIDIPITAPAELLEIKKSYNKPSERARLLIALPNNFDPAGKSYPLLLVSATTDGAASSIATARHYLPDATGKGFVVLAVDGEFGRPPDDSLGFRWALISTALDAVNKAWPQSTSWPVATGGVSGGGGYASYEAIKLAEKRADLIGIFLSVSRWTPANFRDELKRASGSALHNVPVFISAGDKDKIATPKVMDDAHAALLREGFKRVRYEHFAGGHQLNHLHLRGALDWFLQEHAKAGSNSSATPSPGG